MNNRRSGKKVKVQCAGLSEQWNWRMPPSTNTRKKDLTKNKWLEVISMLVMMANEDHLQQGAVMKLAKRYNVPCSMVYRLWECVVHTCAMGIINSPELMS